MSTTDDIWLFQWVWGFGEFPYEEQLDFTKKALVVGLHAFGGYQRVRGPLLFRDHIGTEEALYDFFAEEFQEEKKTNRSYPVSYTGIITDNVSNVTKLGTMVGPVDRLTNLIAQANNLRLQHEEGTVIPFKGELIPINRETTERLMITFSKEAGLPELWSEPYSLFAGLAHRVYQPAIVRKVINAGFEPGPLFPRLWAMRTTIPEVLPQDELLALVGQVVDWEPLGDNRIVVRFNPEKGLRQQLTAIRKRVDDWLMRAGINPRW